MITALFKMPLQPQLDLAPRTWGGARPGAGRKRRTDRHDPDHVLRPEVSATSPIHVVLRTLPSVPRLRQATMYRAIRHALEQAFRTAAFRVVHTSIQSNHLHLIIEASHRDALRRGMQSLAITAARAINRAAGRRGKVFAFRYHATRITTPRQMRNTLAYVLNNWRRHGEDQRSARARAAKIDPYSTAIWFGHWRGTERFEVPSGFAALPAANATSWLLTTGWLRHGAIDPLERPGPHPRSS